MTTIATITTTSGRGCTPTTTITTTNNVFINKSVI
jgi:hypothetical protein